MKLSFTTLGCPDWPLEQIVERAAEYGFDAIDFRGMAGELNIYELPEFSDRLAHTRKLIGDAGLQISCFSSSVQLFSRERFESHLHEISAYARLCEQFDTRYIRVFGGGIGHTQRESAIQTVVHHVNEMAKIVKPAGVKLLIETHDDWIACEELKAVMEQVDAKAVGVLWDVHHPYRMLGEQPEATWEALGKWIEYTHVKDSREGSGPGDYQYRLTGQGDIPLDRIYSLLRSKGYQGYYTLEWEKKWHPELEEPEIVFPQYVEYMRKLAQEA
ncbi:sugar phosphate isomerase/epimerase family protein [Paenibacillus montanisoli]|uniref:Sugar phosphate isomerase/epimerase n=1 Tax=Paenibacillus montanisoli TaxID=2081970 RepID=A0A328U5B5_9BACL|nr:sugar phosphate isomerase/epimerase family protein [Paenibacillus montanisoli]RAP77749.1 sugar phosphate isomerase/epimerase [Paenibacillus montanisoli]